MSGSLDLVKLIFWIQANGSYIPSFTSLHLQPEDGHIPDSEEEDTVKWCSAALYAGGADTVSCTSSDAEKERVLNAR